MIIECIELNCLCKHMKKVRSSQAAILVMNWVKQFFPVSIVNKKSFDCVSLIFFFFAMYFFITFLEGSWKYIPEAYSEPCQTSKMERFAKTVNYFCKTVHLRFWFWIHLCIRSVRSTYFLEFTQARNRHWTYISITTLVTPWPY